MTLRPRDVAAEIADLLHEYLTDGKPASETRLQRRLRALADALEPAVATTTNHVETQAERDVFLYWQRRMQKPQAKLTAERRAKIRARMREGYTVEQIRKAIDAVAESEWHRGSNERGKEYVDLVMICGTGSKLEQYVADYDREHGTGPRGALAAGPLDSEAPGQLRLVELEKTAGELLRRGETGEYNDTQRQIRQLRGGRG